MRGRKGRKSARRKKKRRRSGKKRRSERRSVTARGTENVTEKGREIEGHDEATQTAVTQVVHQTGKGADLATVGGPGAETRTGRGTGSAAGMSGY